MEVIMSKTCNGCTEMQTPVDVPYIVHESTVARQERHIKRLWIALIVAIAMIFASNAAWLLYETQFETMYYEQDGEGINNVNYGDQGDLNNGAESQDKAQEEAE
jgi:hypothetical protein